MTPKLHNVFAFGSNMNLKQMLARCPEAKLLGPGVVHDHRIVFGGYSARWGGAVATIDLAPGRRCHGLLYELTSRDLERLDGYEGVPHYYERITLPVRRGGRGRPRRAFAYRLKTSRRGLPSSEYLGRIWAAYREWGFDADALEDATDGHADLAELREAVRRFRATAAA